MTCGVESVHFSSTRCSFRMQNALTASVPVCKETGVRCSTVSSHVWRDQTRAHKCVEWAFLHHHAADLPVLLQVLCSLDKISAARIADPFMRPPRHCWRNIGSASAQHMHSKN